ncbi:MAG: hypothetical protein IJ936_07000 [Peptococcaceae bacterium]|nr:hypothetical protein [Peptococcaceae bacterium]
MLVFSYILTASLEGALTYMIYRATGEVSFIYALLFFSSIISIPIETSTVGEELRKKAKESGQNLDIYDIIGNLVRFVIYLAVWRGLILPDEGSLYACVCIGATAVISMMRVDMSKLQ